MNDIAMSFHRSFNGSMSSSCGIKAAVNDELNNVYCRSLTSTTLFHHLLLTNKRI